MLPKRAKRLSAPTGGGNSSKSSQTRTGVSSESSADDNEGFRSNKLRPDRRRKMTAENFDDNEEGSKTNIQPRKKARKSTNLYQAKFSKDEIITEIEPQNRRQVTQKARQPEMRSLEDWNKELAQQSAELRDFVDRCQRKCKNLEADTLKALKETCPEDMRPVGHRPMQEKQAAENRLALHQSAVQASGYCRELLDLYESQDKEGCKTSQDAPGQWKEDTEGVNKMLQSGVSYGMNLVDALMRPALEPRLPILDKSRASETEAMAMEMFEGEGELANNSWGRVAQVLVNGWSDFLTTTSTRC